MSGDGGGDDGGDDDGDSDDSDNDNNDNKDDNNQNPFQKIVRKIRPQTDKKSSQNTVNNTEVLSYSPRLRYPIPSSLPTPDPYSGTPPQIWN